MIDENVKIHDKFSVEIKLGYGTKRSKKINDHIIKTWFFIPYSLDINRYTYDKSDFYSDLKTNLRLTTPVYLLRDIAKGEDSPFNFLEKSFEELSIKPIRRNRDEYEYQLKMFHSILKSSLRNEIEHIIKNQVEEDREYLITGYVNYIQEIVDRFRKLRRLINTPTVQKKLMNYYLLSDEFMSNLIEQNTFKLLNSLEKNFHTEYKSTKHLLIGLIKSERSYKKSKGYLVVKKESPDNNSEVIYRWGVLKKYFESRLYLESRKRKDGVFFEQMLYSVAAGLAMVFATVIAFAVQSKYGNFSIPLFIALVISYMFKDRIKELMRFYLAGKLKNRLFDHKTTIRVKENKIGWSKESFDFLPEDKVSKSVLKLRNRSQIMEIEQESANEQILLYRKNMRINRQKLNKNYKHYEITGVNDIIRFNVSRFIKNMDNPEVPAYVLSDKNCVNIKGDKYYYINMIMKFQNEGNSYYGRYRITFNRNGIKKVEKL
ncbi:MAG: hypothetical protein PF489_01935 [Salinivirgaceae bacterium]|jgi:hypothetical protein|nr:hypothetical protein [Salinivirgaceae bacterium]